MTRPSFLPSVKVSAEPPEQLAVAAVLQGSAVVVAAPEEGAAKVHQLE